MSVPSASSPTASQIPLRSSELEMCRLTESFWATASDPAFATSRSGAAQPTTNATRSRRGVRVTAASVTPSARPAGSHAASMRESGWLAPPASCWSGSAPSSSGPEAGK